jgi:hypothetical protein
MEHEPSSGLLCVWRIFGLKRDWGDRPLPSRSWSSSVAGRPEEGDRLRVTIGEVPRPILDAIREWRATGPLLLNSIFGGKPFLGLARDEQKRLIAERAREIDLAELESKYPLYVSLEASRPIMGPEKGEDARAAIEAFGPQAASYLEDAIPLILGALGIDLMPEALLFTDGRAFLIRPNEPAMTIPVTSARAEAFVTALQGWNQLPFASVEEALVRISHGDRPDAKIRRASQLLCAALEHRDDALRRFLFSFVALELLANGPGQDSRRQVMDLLDRTLATVPIEALLWPSSREEDPIDRNLVFKFACLAVAVGGPDAKEDVTRFKTLAAARNGLAHRGEVVSVETAQASSALLAKYLGLLTTKGA